MKMQGNECQDRGIMCLDQGVLVGMRRRPRLGPRLARTHALYGPCVSRTGLSPPACGRRTLAGLHIRDIRPRMLPPSAAPGRRASCTHPCRSFPYVAVFAHMVPSIASVRRAYPRGAIIQPRGISGVLCTPPPQPPVSYIRNYAASGRGTAKAAPVVLARRAQPTIEAV